MNNSKNQEDINSIVENLKFAFNLNKLSDVEEIALVFNKDDVDLYLKLKSNTSHYEINYSKKGIWSQGSTSYFYKPRSIINKNHIERLCLFIKEINDIEMLDKIYKISLTTKTNSYVEMLVLKTNYCVYTHFELTDTGEFAKKHQIENFKRFLHLPTPLVQLI